MSAEEAMPQTIEEAVVSAFAALQSIPRSREARVPMKSGGHYTYSYADLDDTLSYVRPILARFGLAALQDVTENGRGIGVTTRLIHCSGGVMTFGPLPMDGGGNPQAIGSAITYARRYSLLAALGLATEDDDGQTAARSGQEPARAAQGSPQRANRGGSVSSGGSRDRAPESDAQPQTTPPARTEEERRMRTLLVGLGQGDQRRVRQDFMAEFGTNLIGLEPERHVDALAWLMNEVMRIEFDAGDHTAEESTDSGSNEGSSINPPEDEPTAPDDPGDEEPY